MTPTSTTANVIDLTGLPDNAVEAVRAIVGVLRQQAAVTSGVVSFSSREEWIKAIREWADSHMQQQTSADWGRDSIYAGRGE